MAYGSGSTVNARIADHSVLLLAVVAHGAVIVVIGIAMTPDLSATFANIMAIIGGLVGFFGVALAFIGDSDKK